MEAIVVVGDRGEERVRVSDDLPLPEEASVIRSPTMDDVRDEVAALLRAEHNPSSEMLDTPDPWAQVKSGAVFAAFSFSRIFDQLEIDGESRSSVRHQ